MNSTTTLSMTDGTAIVVPNSVDLITPYVLREQADWFEDEIGFLRRLLLPGDQLIDIGANYGVYALSLARAVGPGGRVWAFEPASSTAGLLVESVRANGFAQLVVDQRAVSSAPGKARLALNANSELNSLARDGVPSGSFEMVGLTTLDECMDQYGWRDIRLLKIDAEGEETRIVDGGSRFFRELAPLVLYEIKVGDQWQTELVERFSRVGYQSYRLVPGLDVLAPFAPGEPPDGYLLNLFACKADRADELAAQGYLVRRGEVEAVGPELDRARRDVRYSWENSYADRPFAADNRLAASARSGTAAEVMSQTLALHACSRDRSRPAAVRLAALQRALVLLISADESEPSPTRLSTLARVAQEHGSRALAVHALQALSNSIERATDLAPGGPFLPACERFDGLSTDGRFRDWMLAAALEAFETHASFSSYYTGPAALPRLEWIHRLGWASEEMTRRLTLVRARASR